MPQATATTENFILHLTGAFNAQLLKTGICIWETAQQSSIDSWQAQQKNNLQPHLIIALQFTNSVIRQFMEGLKILNINTAIKTTKQHIILQHGPSIIEQSVAIRLELLHYLASTQNNIQTELWLYEVINNLADISGLIQALYKQC